MEKVTSIMILELLESPDYIHFWCIYRGGSRNSGKGVHVIKARGLLLFYNLMILGGGGGGVEGFEQTP